MHAETTAKAANVGKTAEEVAEAVRVARAAVTSAKAAEAAKLAQEAITAVRLVKYVGPQVLLSLAVDTSFYMYWIVIY
jgi:plasmid maintenance system antidote protein VapI